MCGGQTLTLQIENASLAFREIAGFLLNNVTIFSFPFGGGGGGGGGRAPLLQDLRECNSLGVFKKKAKAYFSSLVSHVATM